MKTIDGVSRPNRRAAPPVKRSAATRATGRTRPHQPSDPVPATPSRYEFLKPHRNRTAAIAATALIAVFLIILWLVVMLPANPAFRNSNSSASRDGSVWSRIATLFTDFKHSLSGTNENNNQNAEVQTLEKKVFPQFNQ